MIHEIKIKAVLNGYIVNVGCQTVVFNDRDMLMCELNHYLHTPAETEKRYREEAINRDLLNNPRLPPTAPCACEDTLAVPAPNPSRQIR